MATKQPTRSLNVGLAIRDDGMLYPALPSVLRQGNYRPYHGKVDATLEERMQYLQGFTQSTAAQVAAEQGTFNIATAAKDDLIDFVANEYGVQMDARKNLAQLRREAIKLAEQADTKPAE